METTELFKPKPKATDLSCIIRKEWVAATPEELVRQRLLTEMIDTLGYPKGWICVEQHLADLVAPAQRHAQVPKRRADILCYSTQLRPDGALHPLLLIECKAVALNEAVFRQVLGYNRYVGAPFVCLANSSQTLLGWQEPNSSHYRFRHDLPSYPQLLAFCRRNLV